MEIKTLKQNIYDIKKVFSDSELNTGKLNININNRSEKDSSSSISNATKHKNKFDIVLNKNTFSSTASIFYRVCVVDKYLYFLLYDFKSLYYSMQSFDEIQKLNQELNPSLEFNDVENLINFLIESILKIENHLSISLSCDNDSIEINFEVLYNIIKVKWSFNCEILDLNIENNYILLQDLFVKPIINILFSFQQFISNEKNIVSNSTSTLNKSELNLSDVELVLGNIFVNKQKNFDKNLLRLTQESTKKINHSSIIEKETNNIHNGMSQNKNLKRKTSDMNSINTINSKKKNFKRRKEDDSISAASISIEREKSSERTISELDDEDKIINKVHIEKKKKSKLKFV